MDVWEVHDARLETRIKESTAHACLKQVSRGLIALGFVDNHLLVQSAVKQVKATFSCSIHSRLALLDACQSCDSPFNEQRKGIQWSMLCWCHWVLSVRMWMTCNSLRALVGATGLCLGACLWWDPKGGELYTTTAKPWETVVDAGLGADVQIVCQSGA